MVQQYFQIFVYLIILEQIIFDRNYMILYTFIVLTKKHTLRLKSHLNRLFSIVNHIIENNLYNLTHSYL